jgi:hypothetical protein
MTCSPRLRVALAAAALFFPGLVSAQNARPDTHTVRPGDTLWDLSRQYLGDPFLWPEIYRLNTNVVEDPHWIYPGEVLRLGGAPEVSSVPAVDTPAPVEAAAEPVAPDQAAAQEPEAAPAEEAPPLAEPQVGDLAAADTAPESSGDVDLTPLVGERSRVTQTGPSLELALARKYRPIRRSEFYSSGFLTENQALPFGTVLGTVVPLQIEEVSHSSTAQLYSRIAVVPPLGGKYQVGDTLLIAVVRDGVRGYGDAVVPTGLVKILDTSRPENVGEVIATYAPIHERQRVLPAEKFNDPGAVRPVRISDGVGGVLLGQRDVQPLTGPQDVVFIDKGRKNGVALGDLFEIRQTPRVRPGAATVVSDVIATVQVVHVGDQTATARVVSVTQPDIRPGAEVRQIAKLPS